MVFGGGGGNTPKATPPGSYPGAPAPQPPQRRRAVPLDGQQPPRPPRGALRQGRRAGRGALPSGMGVVLGWWAGVRNGGERTHSLRYFVVNQDRVLLYSSIFLLVNRNYYFQLLAKLVFQDVAPASCATRHS